jgi:hypothetical protein
LAICLAAAIQKITLGPALALSVNPNWFAAPVGFLIGASRMRGREPAIALAAGILLVGALRSGGWGFEPCVLSAAAFFGGRAWREYFITPENRDFRIIEPLGATLAMLLAATVTVLLDLFSRTAEIASGSHGLTLHNPRAAGFVLPALVGGIIIRRSTSLALFCLSWSVLMWISGVYLSNVNLLPFPATPFPAAWGTLACVIGFAVFGYALDRVGDDAYARALGLVSSGLRQPGDGSMGEDSRRDNDEIATRAVA